ncbi:MAG: ABC-F family ATP-binding cassette domain-containing protein [Parcubacteria group bacterium]|nr:ABC-F family ATP-binding cassette domain-containing protein [Parcubacteria group bacterium]
MAQKEETIVRFSDVSFDYGPKKPILEEVNFGVRRGSKITLMGQNGAGKSTLLGLITGKAKPEDGDIHISPKLSIAIAPQVMHRDKFDLTMRKFFEGSFSEKVYDIDPKIDDVLEVVNLRAEKERKIKDFSGGQQARLLLASALIQNPDLLLLDEPTNNLDKDGVEHLTKFLIDYEKTVIVISHDADFLNAFTEGVLYLDVFTRKMEQYTGNYNDVVKEIVARVEKERRKNAQADKHIQDKKDKANFFANKGGKMRILARRMRDSAQETEDSKVDVRREDKVIRKFNIDVAKHHVGEILHVKSLSIVKDHKVVKRVARISLTKNRHLLLTGPNGIGKSTLLEHLAHGTEKGATIAEGVKVGYYRQDFSTLNFDETVYQTLELVMEKKDEQMLRSVAAGFLITSDIIYTKVGDLSEGQKGLVAFAQLVLLKPNLLILDEPTNHINFRHLPVIAKALDQYEGAMVLVSHVPEFVKQIRIDETLDLEKLKAK